MDYIFNIDNYILSKPREITGYNTPIAKTIELNDYRHINRSTITITKLNNHSPKTVCKIKKDDLILMNLSEEEACLLDKNLFEKYYYKEKTL